MFEYKGDKTWNEVEVGEIVRHQFSNNLLLKTSANKFFDITLNKGGSFPPYLQQGLDKHRLYFTVSTAQKLLSGYHGSGR